MLMLTGKVLASRQIHYGNETCTDCLGKSSKAQAVHMGQEFMDRFEVRAKENHEAGHIQLAARDRYAAATIERWLQNELLLGRPPQFQGKKRSPAEPAPPSKPAEGEG